MARSYFISMPAKSFRLNHCIFIFFKATYCSVGVDIWHKNERLIGKYNPQQKPSYLRKCVLASCIYQILAFTVGQGSRFAGVNLLFGVLLQIHGVVLHHFLYLVHFLTRDHLESSNELSVWPKLYLRKQTWVRLKWTKQLRVQ